MSLPGPLASVDLCITALALAICVTCSLSYALYPRVMPPGFHCFFFKYIWGGPRMTLADWPQSPGSVSYNIDSFASSLERRWQPQQSRALHEGLLRVILPFYAYTHVVIFCQKCCDLITPFLMSSIITYVQSPEVPHSMGLKLAALAVLRGVLRMLCQQSHNSVLDLACTSPTAAGLRVLVLRKLRHLSPTGRARTSTARLQQALHDANDLGFLLWSWNAKGLAVDVALGLYCLRTVWQLYGVASLALTAFVSVFLGGGCALLARVTRQSMQLRRDAEVLRSATLDKLLQCFRPLRACDWLQRAAAPLEEAVQTELEQGRRASLAGCLAGAGFLLCTKMIVPVSYFLSVFIRGGGVSFENGLLVYTNMMILLGSMGSLGGCFGTWFELKLRAASLEAFLRLPEAEEPLGDCSRLEVVGGSFAWPPAEEGVSENFEVGEVVLWAVASGRYAGNWVPARVEAVDGDLYTVHVLPTPDFASAGGVAGGQVDLVAAQALRKSRPTIAGLSFRPRPGELVLVGGGVGEGKSSLLHALVGELVRAGGELRVPAGPLAFQTQVPQLLDGSIRENVLLGAPEVDEALLQRALAVAQLAADMADVRNTLHARKELTVVGRDGTLLSGGQRARVALARSVYAVLTGAQLALLDDPVASVDNEVGQRAWNEAVLGAMSSATRIVAVNAQLLPRLAPTADRLIVLEAGHVAYDGPPQAWAGGSPKGALPAAAEPEVLPAAEAEVPEEEEGKPELELADLLRECEPLRSYLHEGAPLKLSTSQWETLRGKLARLERRTRCARQRPQRSALSVCWSFFRHRSAWFFPAAALMETCGGMESAFTYSTAQAWDNGTIGLSDTASLSLFVFELAFFPLCMAVAGHCTVLGTTAVSARMRRGVNATLAQLGLPYFWRERESAEVRLRSVLGLRMEELAVLGKVPTGLLQVLLLLSVPLRTEPRLLPLAVLGALLTSLATPPRQWLAQQLEPQEREAAARLDVKVLEQLRSSSVLRALGCWPRLEQQLQAAVMSRCFAAHWKHRVGLLVALFSELLSALFVVSGKLVVMRMRIVGATASAALLLDGMTMAVGDVLGLLGSMYSPFLVQVEKLREVCAFLETDCLEVDSGKEPPADWPCGGQISFQNVTFRYAPHAPAAIRNLCLELKPREKLGIVGRTGAGKSTLVSLLLRLGPLDGGRVLLDGVNVAELRLGRLRHAVALVPQEPQLFRASLRENLGELGDAEASAVLVRCGLDARTLTGKTDLEEALAAPLEAEGLSTGQRQLLMAARALARRPAVLVLDECTASLDRAGAEHLLEVVAAQCAEATVLSIAHRLQFVLGSDRILVLGDGGAVLALDTPASLRQSAEGYFATCLRHEELEEEGT